MRIKNLPREKKEELDRALKKSKHYKERDRIQTVTLLSKGYSHKQVSEITKLKPVTITILVSKYNKKGIEGLLLKPHPKNNSKLTIRQKEEIKEILKNNKTPEEYGIKIIEEENYWSTITIRQLVKKLYQIEYKSQESYRGLLKYSGYSYQKVEFEDERKSNEQTIDFKKRFKGKLKKGGFSMWW